jgi:hypothetical protein
MPRQRCRGDVLPERVPTALVRPSTGTGSPGLHEDRGQVERVVIGANEGRRVDDHLAHALGQDLVRDLAREVEDVGAVVASPREPLLQAEVDEVGLARHSDHWSAPHEDAGTQHPARLADT